MTLKPTGAATILRGYSTPNTAEGNLTDGQRDRGRKLAYVCFSRAERDLRIILFTTDPASAKTELVNQGLFRSDQISVQA